MFCATLDWILFTALIIWCTWAIVQPETKKALNYGSDDDNLNETLKQWYSVCVIMLVFAWIYVVMICCVCSLVVPIVCLFAGFIFCMGRQHAERRQREMRARFRIADTVINKLNANKRFSALSSKAKSSEMCVICMENFTEDSLVAELNCDERHIFH